MALRLHRGRTVVYGIGAVAVWMAMRAQSKKSEELILRYPPRFQTASQEALRDVSTGSLLSAYLVYLSCSNSLVTNMGIRVYQFADSVPVLGPISRFCAYKTFYAQFCGGETESEAKLKVEQLRNNGIHTILVYECEDKADVNVTEDKREAQCDRIIEKTYRGFRNSIITASSRPDNMVAIKLTSLVDVRALRNLSTAIEQNVELARGGPIVAALVSGKPLTEIAGLSDFYEAQKVNDMYKLVDDLAVLANEKGVGLLIDAEETWYQRAIELIALQLQHKYNHNKPVVWTTLQMYLKRSQSDLERAIAVSENRCHLAVKLVRGAYMASEHRSLIHDSQQNTNSAYNAAIRRLVDIKDSSVLVATHNYESVVYGLELMESNSGLARSQISFGQLYGMNDDITYALKMSGARVYKYLPYGTVQEVMPYLMRRAQENVGMVESRAFFERATRFKELKRRVLNNIFSSI